MYILEIIHANKTEDLFFEDLEFVNEHKQTMIDYWNSIETKLAQEIYKGKLNKEFQRIKLQDGTYTLNVKHKFFKTPSGAELYWKTFFNSYSQIDLTFSESTKHKKQWAKEHDIRTEVNLLDVYGNFIKTINSCAQGICARFDSCSPDAHCWEKHEVRTNVSYHHIPVQSIKRIQR